MGAEGTIISRISTGLRRTASQKLSCPLLNPPAGCKPHLEQRADDTEEVVKARLRVYSEESGPVEEYYRDAGLLTDFEIVGGIPETLPRLLDAMYEELTS